MSARRPLGAAFALTTAAFAISSFGAATAAAAPFSYRPPGELVTGSGKGRVDTKVYAPGIRFPMESGPAYANSQVWGHGGSSGPGGSQCDVENFSYPWHDNYCETRSWTMPLCPSGTGHQGQDTRTIDCKPDIHWTVAVDDGTITSIGSYSVYLTRADGTRFDYLHMSNVAVKVGQKVKRGDHMGKVSNQFGGTPTTVHLHFNIQQNVSGTGIVYVPPYLSLINAYETLMGTTTPGDASVADTGVSDGATDATSASDASVALDASDDAPPFGIPDTPEEEPLDGGQPAAQADDGASAGCGCRSAGSSRSQGTSSFALLFFPLALALARRRR
jgi:murein DD-endopeptidase MepM/ murein hydrolase activator NlpD